MVEQLRLVFDSMGIDWVLWLLLTLSVISLGIAGERWWYFRKEFSRLSVLQDALKKALAGSQEALNGLRGLEAEVLRETLSHQHMGPEALEEIVIASLSQERAKFDKRLGFLGTLGNNAPFIGLFGTVLGIISAFNSLKSGLSGDNGQNELIMGSISEALVATAVGLLVAIPAVISFNMFKGSIRERANNASSLAHRILADAKSKN